MPEYRSPLWMPGGHLQTILPALFSPRPPVAFRRERWQTPDQDFIDLDFVDGAPGKPVLVLFHGLEGSSDSHYARALMAQIRALGWHGVIPHFRGCSGELNLAPRFYHSGDSQEVAWILARLRTVFPSEKHRKFYVCGVSLGGNALLRYLGESGHQASYIDAACAISAPLNLSAGGAALSKGLNRIYTQMFLRTLKPKCLRKLEQFPGLFPREAMLTARNLYEFDNVVTAPLHGYKNTEDYWHRASACHVLQDIHVRTLVLNARNDPFLPERHLPVSGSDAVTLEYPEHGGHVGFGAGLPPGNLNWLPQKIVSFLES